MRTRLALQVLVACALVASACGGTDASAGPDATTATSTTTSTTMASVSTTVATADATTTTGGTPTGSIDITGAVLTNPAPSCTDHAGTYTSTVRDEATGVAYEGLLEITVAEDACSATSNSIPNHDFNDAGAFVTPVAAIVETYSIPASPAPAASATALSLQYDNAIFLNGVKLDLLAAACYGVGNEPLGQEKIGCFETGTPWRYDPMSPSADFGTDSHNAHTQPDGAYHYHGDPGALYDDSGSVASPVIGFAADGFPIFGPWIDDGGTIRRVVSGYTLKQGDRVSQPGEGAFPGGTPDGTFVDDYEFTGAGDLDECNGMMRNGSYGYYVTDGYPWVLACFVGTPDPSFAKR